MSSLRTFNQKLAAVSRLWEAKDYDSALAEVEELQKTWPGNAHLHILWASLVQLQENPRHGLDDAREALQRAMELGRSSPTGAIVLGHFLDAVEDNPQAAAKVYSEGVAAARQLLLEGLIGQAKALLQVEKREEALRCVMEVLQLLPFEQGAKGNKSEESDLIVRSRTGGVYGVPLQGPYAKQIEELLGEVLPSRSA